MTHRRALLVLPLPLLALLTGCTVPVSGLTGVTVGRDGRPMGVVQSCEAPMDQVLLYVPAKDPEAPPEATWRRSGTPTEFATWPLSGEATGDWAAQRPPKPLTPHVTYALYGATEDSSWSTLPVEFTPEDLAALKPGQVRYATAADPDVYTTGSTDAFRKAACAGE
ncbi:hypothetical protein ACIO3O_07650 [Streptomyces sp. NPDC087440]|uniref:hypothetical protein n=1 Tax=Streptomyces sp. NPDC087440 TaxID=3365790 RepID=UPI003829F005